MEARQMKIEIEIPDLEQIYYSNYDGEELTGKDLKERLVDIAIERFIDKLYDNYMDDKVYDSVKNNVREVVKTRSDEIVSKVVYGVTNEILKKKSIVNEMPKKSEIANISKEWQDYFIELIDKAIAKRFK
jgi:hypothetical protein